MDVSASAFDKVMKKHFRFINLGKLVDGNLVLVGKHPADAIRKYSSWYEFEMRRRDKKGKLGLIRFRIDSTRALRLPGHIGYQFKRMQYYHE